MTRAEFAAGAVAQRNLASLYLARSAFAAQLLDRFDHQENPAHPRMVRRQTPAVGIDRELAVVAQAATADEGATLSAFAEAEVLQRGQDGDREGIVDHRHVDILVADTRTLERQPSRLMGRDLEKVALAARGVTGGLAGAEHVCRALLQIASALSRGHHEGAARSEEH